MDKKLKLLELKGNENIMRKLLMMGPTRNYEQWRKIIILQEKLPTMRTPEPMTTWGKITNLLEELLTMDTMDYEQVRTMTIWQVIYYLIDILN